MDAAVVVLVWVGVAVSVSGAAAIVYTIWAWLYERVWRGSVRLMFRGWGIARYNSGSALSALRHRIGARLIFPFLNEIYKEAADAYNDADRRNSGMIDYHDGRLRSLQQILDWTQGVQRRQ